MKIEASSFLWHNVSARKTKHRKYDASCKKLYQINARNATIISVSISLAKINLDTKNIVALSANISLLLILCLRTGPTNILPVLCAENLHFCITIIVIIQISVAAIKSVITLSLFQSQLLPYLSPCPLCLVKMI